MAQANLDTLDYAGKRDLLYALNVQARVWDANHDPRIAVTMQPENALVNATSGS